VTSLAPELVEPHLTGGFGRPYLYRETCESTQALLDASQPEGAVAVCEEQTGGRGRLGRRWDAPSGSAILSSTLLRPPDGRRIAELALVGGVAAANAVEAALALTAQIKWPNDVLVNRRKVAGVLAEARDGVVVLGIGINVNQTRDELPADAHPSAASLRTTDGVVRERAPVLARLLAELERAYAKWIEGGIDALYVDIGPRDFLRQRRVTLNGLSGIGVGIDRAGRFEVDVAGERHVVESGEVTYER